MQLQHYLAMSLVCMATLLVHQSNAACGSCEKNGIACVNETSFNICYDGTPNRADTFTCPAGEVCTRFGKRCMDADSVEPACFLSKACGVCNESKLFTCTSRTTFSQCSGTTRMNVNGKCPEGYFCRSSGGEICVNECEIAKSGFECDTDTIIN